MEESRRVAVLAENEDGVVVPVNIKPVFYPTAFPPES